FVTTASPLNTAPAWPVGRAVQSFGLSNVVEASGCDDGCPVSQTAKAARGGAASAPNPWQQQSSNAPAETTDAQRIASLLGTTRLCGSEPAINLHDERRRRKGLNRESVPRMSGNRAVTRSLSWRRSPMTCRSAWLLPACLLLLPALVRADEPRSGVRVERGLVYGKGGDVDLKLNLALPATGKGPYPAVVCVHGGGW